MALDLTQRIAELDWPAIERALDEHGHATTGRVLSPGECRRLIGLYADERRFRSRIDMARHRFGLGEYKYFASPLPEVVAAIRVAAFPYLATIANRWMERLGATERFPDDLATFLALCARHGQRRPTPLLLSYETGGFNCLHQDLYGEVAFPLQITSLLSRKLVDFSGGELLLVEQRPRMQSRAEVVAAEQGELVIFPTRYRPVTGARGVYRATMRHGVGRIRSGRRYSLGVIFHDAR